MPPTSLQFAQHFNAPAAAGDHCVPSELGFAAWTCDPGYCVAGTGQGAIAGTLQLRRLSIPGVLSLSNIFLDISVAGGALTAAQCFAGVWDQNGQLVGLTADLAATFAGTGFVQIPLAGGSGLPGPPFIVDTPYIYVGYWWNGTTGPFLVRQAALDAGVVNGATAVPAAQARAVTANAGLTVIGGAPSQLGALTKNAAAPFWAAVA